MTIEELASRLGRGLYETYRTAKVMAKMGLVKVYRGETWGRIIFFIYSVSVVSMAAIVRAQAT